MSRRLPKGTDTILRQLLLVAVFLLAVRSALAAEPPASPLPFPAIEAGMHTAPIRRVAVDAGGRYAVTCSDDKTARLWEVSNGRLLAVLRVPVDAGDEGKLRAVAIGPDAGSVAVAGWTGPDEGPFSVYLFDRASGRLLGRIAGLPGSVNDLAFSRDGRFLAVALSGKHGIRVFGASAPWRELGRDTDYGGAANSVDFDQQGRLVSTSYDGNLRLYDSSFRLVARAKSGSPQPLGGRFSPDGRHIAVAYGDGSSVGVLDGRTLARVYAPDSTADEQRTLHTVAWSADGRYLYAGGLSGRTQERGIIRRWSDGGKGAPLDASVTRGRVTDLVPLASGQMVFGAADPAWGVLSEQHRLLSRQDSPIVDFSAPLDSLGVSANGQYVRFAFDDEGKQTTVFAVPSRSYVGERAGLLPTRTSAPGIAITGWRNTSNPALNGRKLALDPYEASRSLAISPDGAHFAVGTDWSLRWYDRAGRLLWRMPTPGPVWAANVSSNVSQDGRWVVACYGDGTIRWHRASDGREVLALFPHADRKRWVAWTPEGYFDASAGAEDLIGFRLNNGRDQAGRFVAAKQLLERFYRPSLIAQRLDTDGDAMISRALRDLGDVRELLSGAAAVVPQVSILSAVEARSEGAYELKVRVRGEPGRSARVTFRVDGAVVDTREAALTGSDTTISRSFLLPEGKRTITVTAANSYGVESQSAVVNVTVASPAGRRVTLHVLAVGISRYQDSALNLRFAANDAASVRDHFERYGPKLYSAVDARGLLDQDATRANIERELQEIAARAKPGDVFVLYLAGQSATVDGNYHFLPSDVRPASQESVQTRSLGSDRLRVLLANIAASKTVILLDSCSAGGFARLPSRGIEDKQAIDRLSRLTGRFMIAAAADGRMALEGEQGHGAFTYVLLQGLRGAADLNRNGSIEADELSIYVERELPVVTQRKWGYEQFPFSSLQGAAFPLLPVPDR